MDEFTERVALFPDPVALKEVPEGRVFYTEHGDIGQFHPEVADKEGCKAVMLTRPQQTAWLTEQLPQSLKVRVFRTSDEVAQLLEAEAS